MGNGEDWKMILELLISNIDRLSNDFREFRVSHSTETEALTKFREEMLQRMTKIEQKSAGEFKNIYTRIGVITTIAAAVGATIPTIFFLINMYKNAGAPTGH